MDLVDPQEVPLYPGERLEGILHDKIKVIQKENGYRFSLDPLLLAHFVQIKKTDSVIDLGTGSGIIPMILYYRQEIESIIGLELQPDLLDRARRSVKKNGMEEHINIIEGDIRNLHSQFPAESFMVAISNPPYYPSRSGTSNPNEEKSIARHEVELTLEELIDAMSYLLKTKGKAFIIYPVSRLTELIVALKSKMLEPKVIRFVHTTENAAAKLVMVQAIKGGKPDIVVQHPLYVFNLEGLYSDEMQDLLS